MCVFVINVKLNRKIEYCLKQIQPESLHFATVDFIFTFLGSKVTTYRAKIYSNG